MNDIIILYFDEYDWNVIFIVYDSIIKILKGVGLNIFIRNYLLGIHSHFRVYP